MQCHSINTDPVAAERFSKDVLFFTAPSRREIFLTRSNRQKSIFGWLKQNSRSGCKFAI